MNYILNFNEFYSCKVMMNCSDAKKLINNIQTIKEKIGNEYREQIKKLVIDFRDTYQTNVTEFNNQNKNKINENDKKYIDDIVYHINTLEALDLQKEIDKIEQDYNNKYVQKSVDKFMGLDVDEVKKNIQTEREIIAEKFVETIDNDVSDLGKIIGSELTETNIENFFKIIKEKQKKYEEISKKFDPVLKNLNEIANLYEKSLQNKRKEYLELKRKYKYLSEKIDEFYNITVKNYKLKHDELVKKYNDESKKGTNLNNFYIKTILELQNNYDNIRMQYLSKLKTDYKLDMKGVAEIKIINKSDYENVEQKVKCDFNQVNLLKKQILIEYRYGSILYNYYINISEICFNVDSQDENCNQFVKQNGGNNDEKFISICE